MFNEEILYINVSFGDKKVKQSCYLPNYVMVSSTKYTRGSTNFHCNFVYMNKY